MIRKNWTAALCLGLATLLGGDRLAAAEPDQMELLKAKMRKEGWTEVTEGVFERQLGPDKVERIGYGPKGFWWNVGELTRRLENLQKEQALYPSERLATMIEELGAHLTKSKRALWNLEISAEKGLSNAVEAVSGGSCSTLCYSATADAYPLTSSQGVGATATASFNSSCGYSGSTYAYSYARATQGTTTTTHSQSDPDSGTSVTSQAQSSVSGGSVTGIPCYSEALASAESTALGISYSTSDTNSSCPVTCNPTITGTNYEYFYSYSGCVSRTWSVSLSGCTASSYQWKYNGTVVGSGSTYTRNVCGWDGSFTLDVTINGAYSDSHYVSVYVEPPCECGCNGQFCP